MAAMLAQNDVPKEMKQCGHDCYPSSTPRCCACMDEREVLVGSTYPSYTDGKGWTNEGARDDGYCPVCNTKNFQRWLDEMKEKLDQKQQQDDEAMRLKVEATNLAEKDVLRAASTVDGTREPFQYSNGDVYEGEMENGVRSGFGKMTYAADGCVYDGQWACGLHEGTGTKSWADGIEYAGEWKGGVMHGEGKYVMEDGYVMEGRFDNDEYTG